MLTAGWKELLCVALYAALVYAAHSLLRLAFPLTRPEPHPASRIPRSPTVPALFFLAGGLLGPRLELPVFQTPWDATVGPGLILLTAPLSFRAARARLTKFDRPFHQWPFLTPTFMLTAALATNSRGVYDMTLVFLPMCVACMAGIGMAEVVAAHAATRKLTFSRIGGWGLRLIAECLLGALLAAAIVVWRP